MIFDELLAGIFSLIAWIFAPIFFFFYLIYAIVGNFFLLLTEMILGLFFKDISLKRIQTKQKGESSQITGALGLFVLLGVVSGGAYIHEAMTTRTIQLVAEDGHSIPFASIVLHNNNGEEHMRTNVNGRVDISTSGLTQLELRSTRYKKKIWMADEIQPTLIVQRTLLGSGLDKIAKKLIE